MKASELMLGDRVIFGTRTTRIEGIAEGGFSVLLAGEGWRSIADISPLQITPEMLDCRGWKWTGSGDHTMMLMTPYNEEGVRYSLYVSFEKKYIEAYATYPQEIKNGWRRKNKVLLEICGLYVHELQHVFRMLYLPELI